MTKITIITSRSSWFLPHAKEIVTHLETQKCDVDLLTDHEKLPAGQDIVFYLSYFRIVPQTILARSKHNIVIHESDLPKGRGWAPLFWQIIEGKNRIPTVAFEAVEEMDAGPVYATETIDLDGTELHDEIRLAQAHVTRTLVVECVQKYNDGRLTPITQQGEATYYCKRSPEDSCLDPNKTIAEQFDLLRTVHNTEFPAHFELRGQRYVLTITKDSREDL